MNETDHNTTGKTDQTSQTNSLWLSQRLALVRQRIQRAEEEAQRPLGSVRLVAISKFHSAEAITGLYQAGQCLFGENYLQEAVRKQDSIAVNQGIEWHFTGHLQSKKARQALGRFSLIHALDSTSLAQSFGKAWQAKLDEGFMLPPQNILIQVNTGREPQKSGVMPEDLLALADKIHKIEAIRIQGLMCLPPFTDKAEDSRQHFAMLRELKERLSLTLGRDLPELSMGMSHDFELAIAEGATLIRVGTDIFGPRPEK